MTKRRPKKPNVLVLSEKDLDMAWTLYEFYDWDMCEAMLPHGAKDTFGLPLDRNHRNLQMLVMAACVVTNRVGHDKAIDEAKKLMDRPDFAQLVAAALDTYHQLIG